MKKIYWLVLAAGFALAATVARATTVMVATTADGTGTSPLTLRAAINAANNASAGSLPYIIQVPPGTYKLTQGELALGLAEGSGPANKVSIIGTGTAANTIIMQTDNQNRVFNLDPNSLGGSTFALANLTITGGHDVNDGNGGGGILTGNTGVGTADLLNLTNCVIATNSTTGDGAGLGSEGGSVVAIGCTFMKNTLAGGGTMEGAGCFFLPQNSGDTMTAIGCFFLQNTITASGSSQEAEGAGLVVDTDNAIGSLANITNCVFGGNTVTSSGTPANQDYGGGALFVGAASTVHVVGCTFTNNAAIASAGGTSGTGGNGGAILVEENQGSVLVQFCRFIGNTATSGGASGIWGYSDGSSRITANDNWWGANTGPASTATSHITTLTDWLFLTNTASASVEELGTADGLTASFLKDSAGNSISASSLNALINLPVSFGETDGSISSPQTVIQASGTATAIFTGTTAGAGSASASVDGVTSTASIAVEGAVTSISSTPASHAYKAGQTVPITITFDTAVTVTGTPHLALNDGGTASYASGSGGATLTFNYVVSPGDTSAQLDYASTSALTLNGGTISDGGVATVLTLPSPGAAGSLSANTTIVIDTTAPAVAITGQPAAISATNFAGFTFTASDSGSGLAGVTYQLDGGTATAASSPVNLTGLTDGSHTFTLQATDQAGNIGTASYTWTVDTTPPTVTITGHPAASSSTNFASFTFTDSDSGTGVASVKYQLDGGALAAASSPVNLTGLSGGSHTFTLQVTDQAGNVGTASFTWTIGTAPTISGQPADVTAGYGSNATFSVTAAGTGPLADQWYFKGGAIGGATATNYVVTGVTTNDAGNYMVVVTNSFGSVTSRMATLTFSRTIPVVGVASSENPSGFHDSVFFTASLPATASGNVVFSSASGSFSTNGVSGGSASSPALSSLPRGTNLITAIYSGDPNYFGGTNTLSQVVTNHPPVAGNVTNTYVPGTAYLINITNLLAHSVTDADGDPITLTSVGVSTNGMVQSTNATYILFRNTNNVNDQFSYGVSDGHGGSATGTIFMVVNPAGAAGQGSPSSIVVQGAALVTFYGIPGASYTVLRSTNTASGPYQAVWTTNAPAGGQFIFRDAPAPTPSAFYKLSYP